MAGAQTTFFIGYISKQFPNGLLQHAVIFPLFSRSETIAKSQERNNNGNKITTVQLLHSW